MTKYNLDLLDVVDDDKKLLNFLRMEKWLADRPHHPGAAAKQWLIELYKENRLVKGTFELGGEAVDLKRLTMPVLNVYALQDHIIPPPARRRSRRSSAPTTTPSCPCRAGMSGVYVSSQEPGHRRRHRRVQVAHRAAVRCWARSSAQTTRSSVIRDGDTVCISGFVGIGTPEELLIGARAPLPRHRPPARPDPGLRRRPRRRPGPRPQPARPRRPGRSAASAATGRWSRSSPKMAVENRIEAYNLPLGVVSQLYREIAGAKPGMLSKVGLRTFVDPRQQGGRINDAHHRGHRPRSSRSTARSGCSTAPSRSTSPSCAPPPPTRAATPPWSARR